MSKDGQKRILEKAAAGVTGPYRKELPNGSHEWSLEITFTDGKKTTKPSKTKTESIALKKQIKNEIVIQQQVIEMGRDIGEWDGSLFWVERVIVNMMCDVYKAPHDENSRKALTALASAGKTVKVLHDVSEIAERLERAEKMLIEILSASQDGTRATGATSSPGSSARL
jgi:hypothetical protein|tara:strand:+ start:84 stop:590 length:507 start_codon:yes stop_codon:yes gene_type:complete